MKAMKKIQYGLLAVVMAGATGYSSLATADSTYGYAAAGTGTVSATANVNLTVSVAKLLLLRVGSIGSTVDTVALTAVGPSGMTTDGNSQAVSWDGTAPTLVVNNPAALDIKAWNNNSGGATLTCATSGTAAGDITATYTGDVSTCASTQTLARNALKTGTVDYTITDASASAAGNAVAATTLFTLTSL